MCLLACICYVNLHVCARTIIVHPIPRLTKYSDVTAQQLCFLLGFRVLGFGSAWSSRIEHCNSDTTSVFGSWV